jgi:hypothetical protein
MVNRLALMPLALETIVTEARAKIVLLCHLKADCYFRLVLAVSVVVHRRHLRV